MLKGSVAIGAFDLMIRDMILVLELRGVLGDQELRFVVALDALPFRHMAVPFDYVEMTLLAGHPPLDVFPVVEIPAFDIDVALRLEVAGGASADRTGKALFLSFRTGLVVVADETVGFVNGQVLSLDHLGVAGGASQFHPAFQLVQVLAMRKGDILVNHISLEILDLVAALLQTAGIAYLCMRHGWFFPGDEIGKRDLPVDPFAL